MGPVLLVLLQLAAASTPERRFRVGGEVGYEDGLTGAPSYAVLGVSQALRLASGAAEIALGFRLLAGDMTPSPRGAAFVRPSLVARHGIFRPAIGLELELNAATRSRPASDEPEGSATRAFAAEDEASPLRAGVVMAPLRFEWARVFVSAGALRILTPLLRDAGYRMHLGVTFADVGIRL